MIIDEGSRKAMEFIDQAFSAVTNDTMASGKKGKDSFTKYRNVKSPQILCFPFLLSRLPAALMEAFLGQKRGGPAVKEVSIY